MDASVSAREADARERAKGRLRRQRAMLRPVGLVVSVAVVTGAVNGRPAPALHGSGLGVSLALVVFVAVLAFAAQDGFIARAVPTQAGAIAAMGAAGIALVALQPRGSAELAAGAAVWMAVARLPLLLATGIAVATTVGLALAEGLAGASAAVVLAGILLCALLALVAFFVQQARASQETTELLLAQLEDAREQQLRTAALTERSRIAAELHDVLAHSLSGAAIQLQAARKLAERDTAGPDVTGALDRAAELVRDGLANARQAVDALRRDSTPGVADLDALVETFRQDARAHVALEVEGTPSALSPDADLALYRGVQEALTNVARYAPGAPTTVTLRYGPKSVLLVVEDRVEAGALERAELLDVGGGNGLAGLRERVQRSGGELRAGPTDTGWRVELEVPA